MIFAMNKIILIALPMTVLMAVSSCKINQKRPVENPEMPMEAVDAPVLTEEPKEVIWYEHDFSMVYAKSNYVSASAVVPQTDQTVLITRVGDKVYIQTRLHGTIKKCEVYEALPVGYRSTIYEGGKVTWTHDYDNQSLTSALAFLLRKTYSVLASVPKDVLSQAREGSCCGRPCWIVQVEEDTELGKGHLVSTLYVDKEYGFLYSVNIKGTNDLGKKVDMQSFTVTSFTDQPTAKDIPDPTQSTGGTAALKKQLQDQIDALKK